MSGVTWVVCLFAIPVVATWHHTGHLAVPADRCCRAGRHDERQRVMRRVGGRR